MRLDTLTYNFISQDDPEFQKKLTEMPGFRELAMPEIPDPLPKRGSLIPHQKLAERFYNIYDEGAEAKEPGTGKTGVAYACAESFRKNYGTSPESAYKAGVVNWIKQAVILVPGDNIEKSWVESYHKYSDLNMPPEYYHFEHHSGFYLRNKNVTWSVLIKIYRNTFFFIDEVHRIINRSTEEKTDKKVLKEMWNWYHKFFRIIPDIKVIVASGTMVVMNKNEIGYIMNLMPGVNMPLDKKWYENLTEEELEEHLRGRVSHLKNKQFKSRITWPKDAVALNEYADMTLKTDEHIIPLIMSEYQTNRYRDVYSHKDPFNSRAINTSLIAIPEKYVQKETKQGITIKQNFAVRIQDKEFLKDISCKQYRLPKDLKNNPGIAFVISDFKKYSVEISINVLINEGYEEYEPKIGRDDSNLPKAKRFAIIKAESASTNNKIIEYSNQYKNRHGEYLKLLLSPRVGGEGISLRNVQSYIVLDPGRNISTEVQRQNRIFRPDSYDDLYNENISNGMTPEEAIVDVKFFRYTAFPNDEALPSVDLEIQISNIEKDVPLEDMRLMLSRIAYDAQIHFDYNQHNCGYLMEDTCEYGFFDPPAEGTVSNINQQTYDLLYGHELLKDSMKKLIDVLSEELSIDIDDFLQLLPKKVPKIGLYRSVLRLLNAGGRTINSYGNYIFLRNEGNTLYIQTEDHVQHGNYANFPDTAIYSDAHISMTLPIATFTSAYSLNFDKTKKLGRWLDDANVALSQKIDVIENILVNGSKAANMIETDKETRKLIRQYNYILERYGDKTVFIFKKPLRRLQFLSNIPNIKVRAKVPIGKYENITSDDDVIVHVFYAQYHENKGTKYDIFSAHTGVKRVSLFEANTSKFVKLDDKGAEFLVYSDMIRTIINTKYDDFKNWVMNKRYGKIYGIVYEPEMVFRISDNRLPVGLTKHNIPSKSKIKRGQKCGSHNVENLVDFAIYLGLKPPINKLDTKTLDLSKSSVKKSRTAINSNTRYKIIIDANKEQYADAYNLVLFFKWVSLYTGKSKPEDKDPLCELIYNRLFDKNQIYYF